MKANEAILGELGDLFTSAESVAVDAKENTEERDPLFVYEDDEDFKGAVKVDDNDEYEIEEETVEEEDESSDLFDFVDEIVAQKQDGEAASNDSVAMTNEEREACIEAASDAMMSRRMAPPEFEWGLDFIKKMYEDENAAIQARIDAVDRDAVRAEYAAEEAKEEAEEQKERERFIKSS